MNRRSVRPKLDPQYGFDVSHSPSPASRRPDHKNNHDSAAMIDPAVRLQRAIRAKDLALVKRIVKFHPKAIHTYAPLENANRPLHLAAQLGLEDIANFLIEAGHEDERVSRNVFGETPLMLAIPVSESLTRILASRFPRCIPWQTTNTGMNAVMVAAKHGSASIVAGLISLIDDPNDILHETDLEGNTALHYASSWGNLKCISTLLSLGADPTAKNKQGWSAVDYSMTVSAEVYFKSMILEAERKKAVAASSASESDIASPILAPVRTNSGPSTPAGFSGTMILGTSPRRKEGTVRMVDPQSTGDMSPLSERPGLFTSDSGRTTPSGGHRNFFKLRNRAGSTE